MVRMGMSNTMVQVIKAQLFLTPMYLHDYETALCRTSFVHLLAMKELAFTQGII
jgi:hypothetical protein